MHSSNMLNQKATILIELKTRNRLRYIGRKEQTYDDIINELIRVKNNVPKDSNITNRAEVN